jgi:hypothetical protein
LAARKSFKSDESFLEKISIGAIGTRSVFQDLNAQGHNPIELERGSMSYKIWKKIKIKRIRVPDILLLNNGIRVESRAKTTLEISMSHSFSDPDRGWDFGLADDDFIGFVVCSRVGEKPIDWQAESLVQYVLVKDLRKAYSQGQVIGANPKGAQEGFETRLTWPAAIAKHDGEVKLINEERLQYTRLSDNRTISLRLNRGSDASLNPLVQVGERVTPNQIIASVVPVTRIIPADRTVSEREYIAGLESSSLSERYASAKALSHFHSDAVDQSLLNKVSDEKDHIYVRLEASASLARHSNDRGILFVQECLSNDYLTHILEAVIILSEIGTPTAGKLLVQVLTDVKQDPEIRAGAAWALGELQDKAALEALIESFMSQDEEIRIEAARALAKISRRFNADVVQTFASNEVTKRDGIAWAISKSGNFSLDQLFAQMVDDNARRWVAYIIGSQDKEVYLNQIERLKSQDTEVYFAVTVLWQIMRSWIYGLEEYG